MVFGWLKQYMPRGLYGRALLILILPVLTLQLLVSVVFIQRHFDGVTQQMAGAVAIELRYVLALADAAPDRAAAEVALSGAAEGLELAVDWAAAVPAPGDDRAWWDFTGDNVVADLQASVPQVAAVSLADRRQVRLWLETRHGPLQVVFARDRVSASNPHQLLVIMVVMGAIMTTIAYFFLRNQLRPIKRMAAAAQAYGKGRIAAYSPSGAVEVRAAGTAFLDMRNRLERQSQARTMMLSGVSHDLRTPLTRLRLGLSMLDDTQAEDLIRDVDEMQRLVDAFLDFARSDAGDEVEVVSPHGILADVLAEAARMGRAVTAGPVSGPESEVPLRPLAVRRALENLIGNGLRYGGRVEVGLQVTDRSLCFTVEDDGPGIPADQRETAMRPFVRLDPARNQNKGSGVGLGLAIVADIARSHGGVLRLGDSARLGGLKADLVLAR